jgi:hypothetical protein
MAIQRNSARCLNCLDEIESKHHHDFVTCSCGAISVDGGKQYFKRSVQNFAFFEDTSEVIPDEEVADSYGPLDSAKHLTPKVS